MKIFLTGVTGFLGRRVARELGGHELLGLARSEPSTAALRAIDVQPVSGDLRDASSLAAALATAQPDAIVHLAAETAVQRREELVWETNFVGTESLRATRARWRGARQARAVSSRWAETSG